MFETDKYQRKLHRGEPARPTSPYQPEMAVESSLSSIGQSTASNVPRLPATRAAICISRETTNAAGGSLSGRFGIPIFRFSPRLWRRNIVQEMGQDRELRQSCIISGEDRKMARTPVGPVRPRRQRHRKTPWQGNWQCQLGQRNLYCTGKLARRMDRNRSGSASPHAFLLEVYNPIAETVRMQLNFAPSKEEIAGPANLVQLLPSFVTTVEFPSGYSRHEIDQSMFRAVTESDHPFKISLIPEADNNVRLVFLTADFVKFSRKPVASNEAKKLKCVVWVI